MEQNRNIDLEVEKTLNSLNDYKKVETDAFFYTRLMARIERKQESEAVPYFFSIPYLKPAMVSFLILINLFVALSFLYFDNANKEVDNQLVNGFANSYSGSENTDYLSYTDIEN